MIFWFAARSRSLRVGGLLFALPPQRSRQVASVICHRVGNRVDDFLVCGS
jgi:hypothetical protein